MLNQMVMMSHVGLGVLGILAAVAMYVDVLNANQGNYQRIKNTSVLVSVFIVLAYLIGGYWYVFYYGHDRDIIKAGPWPWAHNYFMEVKEHVFFLMLMLAIYLPISVREGRFLTDKSGKTLVQGVLLLIILLGFFMEGAGGLIGKGVTMGLMGR